MEESKGDAGEGNGMAVTVLVGDNPAMRIRIAVGDGSQTVRWLALAASQRYTRQLQAQGRARQREGNLTEVGDFWPAGVFLGTGANSQSINPVLRVNEIAENGSEFRVPLQRQVHLTQDGAPELCYWSTQSFRHTEVSKMQAAEYQRRIRVGASGGSVTLRGGGRSKSTVAAADNSYGAQHLDNMAGGVGLESMAAAVEYDWQRIDVEGVFAGDKTAQLDAKTQVLTWFSDLSTVLAHYASYSGQQTVTYIETFHLMHHCSILNLKEGNAYDLALLNQCVYESTGAKEGSRPDLHRHHFVEMLLRMLGKKLKTSSIPQELEKVFKDKIAPIADALRNPPMNHLRVAMRESPELKACLKDNNVMLKGLFTQYAMQSRDEDVLPSLTLQETHLLFRDADLVPGFDEVAKFQCTKAVFAHAQRLTQKSNVVGSSSKAGFPDTLPSLVFREFMESIILVMAERNPLFAADPVEGLNEALHGLRLVTPDTGTRGPMLDFDK